MKIIRSFEPGDRYRYNFDLCSFARGWAQIDSAQDASWFGTWASPAERTILNFAEGDVTRTVCEADEKFAAALREIDRWNRDQGYGPVQIDPGFDPALNAAFKVVGLGGHVTPRARQFCADLHLAGRAPYPTPVLMNTTPDPLLTALSRAPDDATFARLLRDGGRVLLRDPSGIGAVAVAALGAPGEITHAAAHLLASALDQARIAVENDLPEGPALLAALAEAVAGREGRAPLAVPERLALARAYASAGLVPPPFATLTADSFAGPVPDGTTMPDLGEILDPLLRDAGEALGQAHAAMTELLAGLPPELATMLVAMTVARPGAAEARLALYWLLDPRADIRLAAATALLSRPGLPPDLAVLLPTLRKWMPDDSARAAVDATIRAQMRAGARPAAPVIKVHRAAVSLPDGVGAQSLAATVQIGSRRVVAMAMLKAGHGVKDAFLIPCASATEQKALMARVLDEVDAFDLPPPAFAAILARGLGEGLALGRPPAPGMVDMADIWGPEALTPQAFAVADILAALGPLPGPLSEAALIQSSSVWLDQFPHLHSWFEDTGPLREALSRARTEKGLEAVVWKQLATRRDHWARIMATSAAVLHAVKDPHWPAFAAVAHALIGDHPLKRIPALHDIVGITLAAWADGAGAAEGESGDGAEALLDRAGLRAAFLDGYLTAYAITPTAPPPTVWLSNLLGGIEFPGERSINRIMAVLSDRIAQIENMAPNPATMAGYLSALAPDDWQDWCAGFHALVEAAPRAWTPRSLGADDKRILRTIAQAAEGQPDTGLATVLPAWIAGRHARRK